MKPTPLLQCCALLAGAFSVLHSADLPRATPESQGIPSEAILQVLAGAEAVPENALHSLIIVRHGHVVAEGYWAPYTAEQPHEMFSLSKSFTSTAIGFAQAEGLLSIDDPVLSFFPEEAPADPAKHIRWLRIRQLLTMTTGHVDEPRIFDLPADGPTLVEAFLATKPEFQPGVHFRYNTPATYMQSAIVQAATGERVRDYLMPRLFEPLGIPEPHWDQSPQGIDLGGFGLELRTREIARFGQLLLQQGEWEGRQVVPAGWIAEATSKQTSNGADPESDWNQGYGFQFWRNTVGGFRGDGAFGQLCIVLPEHDLVIAATAGCRSIGDELHWFWDNLLPALSDRPLKENPGAHGKLEAKLATLALRQPIGSTTSPLASIPRAVFELEENELGLRFLECVFGADESRLSFHRIDGFETLTWKPGEWTRGELTRDPKVGPIPVFVAGAWESDEVLKLHVIYAGKAQNAWITLRFKDGHVTMETELNVNFGPVNLPMIEGSQVSRTD